jgi:hypothetical protein
MSSSIRKENFFGEEELISELTRRQKELEVVRSELSVDAKSREPAVKRNIYVGSGPGSVLFMADDTAKVRSDVEKELVQVKNKLDKKTASVEKSSVLNF